jgi:hypothetical protein
MLVLVPQEAIKNKSGRLTQVKSAVRRSCCCSEEEVGSRKRGRGGEMRAPVPSVLVIDHMQSIVLVQYILYANYLLPTLDEDSTSSTSKFLQHPGYLIRKYKSTPYHKPAVWENHEKFLFGEAAILRPEDRGHSQET